VVLGKAVRHAGISGRHVMTKLRRKIQAIGQNMERWERDEVQIPGTKIALERAILDTLGLEPFHLLPTACCQAVEKPLFPLSVDHQWTIQCPTEM
jgi:hypothetical protein